MSWVKVETITGGQLVHCLLCGKKVCHETFWASDTNHAEAYRLAVAYAWHHEHSGPHIEALRAFRSNEEPPSWSSHELLLAEIFNKPLDDEPMARRRKWAKMVAERVMRADRGSRRRGGRT